LSGQLERVSIELLSGEVIGDRLVGSLLLQDGASALIYLFVFFSSVDGYDYACFNVGQPHDRSSRNHRCLHRVGGHVAIYLPNLAHVTNYGVPN